MRSKRASGWVAGALSCGLAAAAGCGLDALGTGDAANTTGDALAPDAPARDALATEGGHEVQLDGGDPDAKVDASCGDVLSSALDCGRCGHSCLGGACAAGKCQPVVLVSGEPGLGAVALDATYAYYAVENSGFIRKVPLAGGVSVDVYGTGRAPHDLVLDGDRLFWTDQFGPGLYVFATNSAVKLIGGGTAIATTPIGLYFISPPTVDLWDRAFNSAIESFTNSGASPAIVTNGTHAYWSAGQQIRAVTHASNNVVNVVTGIGANPTSMAISATHVYWTTATKVQRAPIGATPGWSIATIVASEGSAASLTVDATHAYWLDLNSGALRRAPLAGGTAETLATFTTQSVDAPYPHQIALSADAIYVASTSSGTLSRLAK